MPENKDWQYWKSMCEIAEKERDELLKKIARLENEIARQSETVQREWLSPFEAAGLRDALKRALANQKEQG